MMWPHSLTFWRETKRDGDVEVLERSHLSIKPVLRAGPHAVGPTQTCSNMSNAKCLEPSYGSVEPMIFKMKPLTDPELRRHFGETPRCEFRSPIFAQ
jgi:hypothetical protein